jgi:hypothetical protein
VEELAGDVAAIAEDLWIDEFFLVAGGGVTRILRNRLGNATGQRAVATVSQKDFITGDGELVLSQLFISEQLGQIHGVGRYGKQ